MNQNFMQTPQDGTQNTDKTVTKPNEGQGTFNENNLNDYKSKFANSTRENMILRSRLGEISQKVDEITKSQIPSDEEMARMYPQEWEEMDDFQKSTLKRDVARERKINSLFMKIDDITSNSKRESALYGLVLSDHRLSGKEQEFIEFCSKPTRQNVEPDILLNAFLYEVADQTPANTAPVLQKPVGLESGTPSGGQSPLRANSQMTDEQLNNLRTSDPKAYNEMIRRGQI